MNIQDRIEALKHWSRGPRDVIVADDPDFLAWLAVLPSNFKRHALKDYSSSGTPTKRDLFAAFRLWLQVTDAGMRDYWRFIRYLGKRQLRPAHKQAGVKNSPQYPLNVAGFLRFLEKEPGRTIPAVFAAVGGWAIGGPVGSAAAYGAARGAQNADEAGKNVVGGAALGAVAGYGAAAAAMAPLLGIALPVAAAPASQAGRALAGVAPPARNRSEAMARSIDSPQYPEQYRRLLNSLIEVESGGDPNAVSPSGTYVGLLQMGPLAAEDIGLDNYKGALLGNATAAIDAFWAYQALYKSRTSGHPFLMALLWKGGPGTLRTFRTAVQAGSSVTQALRSSPTSNVYQYMSRFAQAWRDQ